MNTLPRNSNFLNPPIVLTVVASFPLVLDFLLLQRHPDHVAGYYNCFPLQRETAIARVHDQVHCKGKIELLPWARVRMQLEGAMR